MANRNRRGISLGTLVMLACTIGVLAGFVALMPSLTGNHDLLIDAARLAVAIDDSLSQLTASTGVLIQQKPQSTIIPPFTSQNPGPAGEPTAVPTATPAPKLSFTLCASGAVELDSSVRKALTYSDTTHFEVLTDQMRQQMNADLSVLTLKNVISASNDLTNVNMPSELLPAIRTMGVNTVNIGHLSTLSFGEQGLSETIQAIENAGMAAFGAKQPTALRLNGVNVALLHYQDAHSTTTRKKMNDKEIQSIIFPIDLAAITSDIAAVRNAGAQVVIVSLWWGRNGSSEPTDEQIVQAQAIADAGADLILGAGSGSLQPVQVLTAHRDDGKYHPVLCAYSLGNLFSPDRDSRITLAGILLKTKVVYDTATQTVAFENLTYTPTYAWRGKDEGRTLQRILINDPSQLPAFVDSSQQGVMERCMTLVNTVMADTTIPMTY